MFSFNARQILDARLAGFRDNVALLTAVGGGMLANPLLADLTYSRLLGAAISGVGGYMLGQRYTNLTRKRVFDSTVNVVSSSGRNVDLDRDWGGILLGFTVDTAKPVVIPWNDWLSHCFILGQSGMGKTVLGEWIMFQQIMAGGGLLWIDGKIDSDNINKLNAMCAYASRRHDLRVINPDDPSNSNTYNPILKGDADEVASRIISLIPSAENNPGADHYRQSANQGVTTTVNTIREAGYGYSFLDLSILLQSEEAMHHLEEIVPEGSYAQRMYHIFLERFKVTDRQGTRRLDLKKIADLFGGIGGRLFSFGEGNFGKITNTYAPEVDLYQDVLAGRVIYVALPTMGKNEAAGQFGKMAIGDYRSAISKIQSLPKGERPWPPTLGFFDEAGSYVNDSWSRIFEQSRSANQVLVPAVQTVANLDAVSQELREMVLGNTVTKVVFRVGTNDTAEIIADFIDKENVTKVSVSSGGSESQSAYAGTRAIHGTNSGSSASYSEREEEVYRVSTRDLKSLAKGEAIVCTDGGKVMHIKIPRVVFSKDFLRSVGQFEVNHVYQPYSKGLNLFDIFGAPE